MSRVKVASVEEFQGQVREVRVAAQNDAHPSLQERKIIIISTVRSSKSRIETDLRHALGFVSNPRRFNGMARFSYVTQCAKLCTVAVTRAKALLIVVGDPATLAMDPLWRRFLALIHRNGGWAGHEIPWDPEQEIEDGQLEEATRIGILGNMQRLAERVEALTLDAVFVEPDDGDDDL